MRNFYRNSLAAIMLILACAVHAGAADPVKLEILNVQKIWSVPGQHCAFTDLIWYGDRFLCTFREGKTHASPDGKIRVLASSDSEKWESIALLASDQYDLRDPKLSQMPNGRLMMIGGASTYAPNAEGEQKPAVRHTFVSFSEDGATWTTPKVITRSEDDLWIWRVTWHKGIAYGVGKKYHKGISLATSRDGENFQHHPPMLTELWPNEATLRFGEDDTAYCLVRREGTMGEDKKWSRPSALLGVSKPPYMEWNWLDTKLYLGGPNLIRLPDGRWIIGARTRQGSAKTALLELNVETGDTKPLVTLPSGGDCSYTGLVIRDGVLCVSYYSSHEDASSIYLAKVKTQ